MSEKPILFNGEMVRAILEGRKTQTRRPMTLQPSSGLRYSPFVLSGIEDGHGREIRPAYYPGDTLWVREGIERRHGILTGTLDGLSGALYLATRTAVMGNGPAGRYVNGRALVDWQWKHDVLPAMHMPRWASRITLEVTDVRAERLQDISDKDVHAEGFAPWGDKFISFAVKWDSIYAKRGLGWDENPWVWAYTFKVVTP